MKYNRLIMSNKLNILLITSEDNGQQFSCYGDHTQPTPHVDALASQGTRFNNAYVTQAVCSPGRSSILTGLYPHQNGQIGLASHCFSMFKAFPSIPTLLKQNQYRTGRIGKLHILPESAFDFDMVWNPPEQISFSHRNAKAITQTAGQFIHESDQPFFLMLNYPDAHLPWIDQDNDLPSNPLTADDVEVLPQAGIDTPRLRAQTASYYNCIARLDASIGMLMQTLEASGKADNTLVIYITDHGPQFSRGKGCISELALRAPLLIRWPGVAQPQNVRDELVSQIDILPTVLDAAGVTPPADLPGRSLKPLLTNQPCSNWPKHLFAEWNTSHPFPLPGLLYPQRSVRDDRYKLILNLLADSPSPVEAYYTTQALVKSGANEAEIDAATPKIRDVYARWRQPPAIELYDLQNDPNEFENLAEDPRYTRVLDELLAVLQRWQHDTHDAMADPANLAKLVQEHQQASQLQGGHKQPDFKWNYHTYLAPTAM